MEVREMPIAKCPPFAGLAAVLLAPAALAAPAVGLVGDATLVFFDTAAPQVTRSVAVAGVEPLLGIDVRPADRKLYGVGIHGTLVTIDVATGQATKVGQLSHTLPPRTAGMVDFNPVADRIRVMGHDGTNLRVDPANGKAVVDGKLAFEATDPNAKLLPNVVATAYTNSYGKPERTAMYDIEGTLGALLQQTKPNDGTLKEIGKLGTGRAQHFAFDIQADAAGKNTAWLVADNKVHTVDLATGAATAVGEIAGAPGRLRDIAILP